MAPAGYNIIRILKYLRRHAYYKIQRRQEKQTVKQLLNSPRLSSPRFGKAQNVHSCEMSLSNHRLAHKLCHRSMLFVGRYISVYELRNRHQSGHREIPAE